MRPYHPFILLLAAALGGGCHQGESPAPQLSEEAQIGKALFFDAALSTPAGQSCASCHSPQHGFAAPQQDSPVSPGAVAGRFGNRNAPSLAYAAYSPAFHFDREEGLYIGGQFLDGRAVNLEAQALQPMLNPLEMNNADMQTLAAKVRKAPYASRLRHYYGEQSLKDDAGTLQAVVRALAAYERSTEVAPFSSRYDLYLAGRLSLSEQEMRGLRVFEDEKKGNCAACHPSGRGEDGSAPLFTDFSYDNLGVPANPANPYYAMARSHNPRGKSYVDRGLGATVNDAAEDGKFKVPTLRNIALTAPYMHNGVFATLEEVVAFYNSRDTDPQWGAPELKANVNGEELGDLKLSEEEMSDLVAFLHTLSDGYQQ